eukprot:545790-Prymnesium_polylepis.1
MWIVTTLSFALTLGHEPFGALSPDDETPGLIDRIASSVRIDRDDAKLDDAATRNTNGSTVERLRRDFPRVTRRDSAAWSPTKSALPQ